MEDAEEECNQNVRRMKARLRLTDPDGEDPGLVANFHDAWHKKLKECVANVVYAVRKLCNDFGIILGSDKVKAWKATVATCKKEFCERLKTWWVVVQHWANGSVPQPSPVLGEAQEALADIAVSYEIIEEVSAEESAFTVGYQPTLATDMGSMQE